ncbi:MAG TPA: peptidyl-prolyl cis-trans isomerase [Gemmatimonadales bacterium]|nr:peptidyl-prolyl cis-trans isomerase [Gemmatimonadales bacterium]
MMRAFRNSVKYAAPLFALLMLVFLVTSVDWNTFFSGNQSVGEINGREIDARAYENAVQQAMSQQQGRALGLEDVARVRDEVWQQFVESEILRAEYERRGLTVSTEELAEAIKNVPPQELADVPEFQTNGKFDLAKYQRWLQSTAAQPYLPAFEARYREEILRSKLLRQVTADLYLSDAALWRRFRDENERVKIRLAAIVPRTVVPDSAVPVSAQEIEAYYKAHPEEFERPRTAYLSYVALSRLPDASDTAAALARANQIRQEILGGAPFAEVARRESADTVSAKEGGDLGEWTRGSFDPAFEEWAFKAPVNAISPPVLTSFGYHIIQVTSRQGDKAKGRHILIPIEPAGEHRDRLDARADSLEELAAERLDPAALDTVARALNLRIGKSNPVQEGTRVQLGAIVVPDAGVWAFRAQEGEISPIIETEYAYYLFRLDSLQPKGVPPLAQIRDAVAHTVREQKKWEKARELAAQLKKRVAEGTPLARAADAMGLPNRELGPFTRISPPLPNPMLVGAAFGLEPGAVSDVLDTKDGLYMLQVLERTKADSAEFVKKLDELRPQAVRLARQDRARNYLTALRDAARIEDRRVMRTEAQLQAEADAQAEAQRALGGS